MSNSDNEPEPQYWKITNQKIERTYMIKLIIGIASASIVGITTAFSNAITGPSSSESPYLLRARPDVVTFSVFTVGDSVNFKPDGITPYRIVGTADGLGAYEIGRAHVCT